MIPEVPKVLIFCEQWGTEVVRKVPDMSHITGYLDKSLGMYTKISDVTRRTCTKFLVSSICLEIVRFHLFSALPTVWYSSQEVDVLEKIHGRNPTCVKEIWGMLDR